ncbi:HAD family hydrolase [Streptomyces sp. NPDC090036]|uniref:HAD family hydrolase n=1 Tax=Streptomyces sp. NPDC090036 TaxID=3365926 RepID=UPI00381E6A70
MKRAVLFDLDGVLVDSRAAQLATLAGFATSVLDRRVTIEDLPPGAETTPREQVLAHLGLDGAIDKNGWDAASATATLVAKVFPFVVETLTDLRAADIATGVVTLRSRRCLHWLLPPDVIDLLDTTVCYEDATPKPSPDGLLLALDQLGATPGSAVFVGDTYTDIHAARAAGVTAVGAGWGFAGTDALTRTGADLVLSEPADLTSALLRLVGVPQLNGFPSDLDS